MGAAAWGFPVAGLATGLATGVTLWAALTLGLPNQVEGFTDWVYGRAGRSCRRCGTRIRKGELGADPTRERITFWCPSCQR